MKENGVKIRSLIVSCSFLCMLIIASLLFPRQVSADSADFLIGDWNTSDGVSLSFYDDGYFDMQWSFFPAEEGMWYAETITQDTMYIEMDGSIILSLMSLMYGAASSDYHFEILKCNNDNFYLVQVYDTYTAKSSPCKLGFTRVGARQDFSYNPNELPEKKIVSDLEFNYYGYDVKYSDSYFTKDPTVPDNDLAMFCGVLNWAVFHDSDKPSIEKVYAELGIPDEDIFDNAVEREKELRFSIAKKTLYLDDVETNLLIICARGTVSEGLRDHFTKAESDFFGYTAYDLIYEFEEKNDEGSIMSELGNFVNAHPDLEEKPLKILITGYSLGGAAANLAAARFDMFADSGAWWSDLVTKRDIYCYTFGAIDSIKSEGTISKGFENIHNITNFHDSFGPKGWHEWFTAAGHTRYGKFGHIDLFDTDKDKGVPFSMGNHLLDTYLDAVRDHKIEYENPANQKIASFHCPVDIKVYDGDDLVGQVVNDEVDYSVTTIPIYVAGSSKYVLFRENNNYRFEINGTDNGTMNYVISDADTGKCLKSFDNVSLTKGKELSSSVSGEMNVSDVKLYVVDGKNSIMAEVMENGSEVMVGGTQEVTRESEKASISTSGNDKSSEKEDRSTVTIPKKTLMMIIIAAGIVFAAFIVIIIVISKKKNSRR